MSDFCRHHGFYAPCPSCSGEEVIWEIPVVDCAGTGGVDVFRVNAGVYEDAMALPAQMVESGRFQSGIPATASGQSSRGSDSLGMPAARDHIPLPVDPALYARVRLILETPVAPV